MRWRGGRRSSNIEDRRDQRTAGRGFGGRGLGRGSSRLPGGLGRMGGRGSGMRLPRMGRRGGFGSLGFIVIVLIVLYFSGGLEDMTGGVPLGQAPDAPRSQSEFTAQEQELADFVSVVLADTEDTWHILFENLGRGYDEPTLVLFSGAVDSACGFAQAAVGPFYCPLDQRVYIDLEFFNDLAQRFQAPGDFAQAYVIAHEIGHHVQTLLGISAQVRAVQQQSSEAEANALSVRLELQADCLAGVWANHADRARDLLEVGDIEEGLAAASAIGDDRLQRQSRGYVTPESFTHGSSAQRVAWFRRGLDEGTPAACDTFSAKTL